jgi:hypothetical protein
VATILEDGDIYFLYRPRVEREQVHSVEDVQRLLIVLHPRQRQRYRLLIGGRKRLPEVDEHERFWCFVDRVVQRPEELRDSLDERTYETKTRGKRMQPPARSVGEGAYVIAKHDDHTHLAYRLELPRELGEPQHELNIEHEVSYIVSVRNPDAPAPSDMGRPTRQRPRLPRELLDRFRGRRFIALDPPDFLDFPGTEIVLIGAARDPARELDLDTEVEKAAHQTIFDDLRVSRQDRPVEPLFSGQWR